MNMHVFPQASLVRFIFHQIPMVIRRNICPLLISRKLVTALIPYVMLSPKDVIWGLVALCWCFTSRDDWILVYSSFFVLKGRVAAFKHSGMWAWVALIKACSVALLQLSADSASSRGGRQEANRQEAVLQFLIYQSF